MFSVLAVDVDLVSVMTMIVGITAPVLTAMWVGGKQICVYLWKYAEPKISKVYDEHVGLVADMRENVPKVTSTMEALSENQVKLVDTQVQQCSTLKQLSDASARHEQLHAQTGEKLDQIFKHLSANDMPVGK